MKSQLTVLLIIFSATKLFSQDIDQLKATTDQLIAHLVKEYNADMSIYTIVIGDQVISGSSSELSTKQFRVASVSKIITTVAILKLVNKGRLDLNVDIRDIIFFKTNERKYQTVTIGHLLTHTSGFDNSDIGDATNDPSKVLNIEDFLASKEINQVFTPGTYWRYSNYNFLLLGRIIEQVTGMKYHEAIDNLIFQPYGMSNSDFHQPSSNWPENIVVSSELQLSLVTPADGLNTTSSDMGLFIQGIYKDSLLCKKLFQNRFEYGTNLPGQAYGLRLEPVGKTRRLSGKSRIYVHPGHIQEFESEIIFIPGLKAGLFTSTYKGSYMVNYNLSNEVLNFIYEGENYDAYSKQMPEIPFHQLEGTYFKQNVNRSTIEKFGALLSKNNFLKIAIEDENFIVNGDQKMIYIGNDEWVVLETGQRLIIKEYDGKMHVFSGYNAYKEISFFSQRSTQIGIYFGSLLLFVIASLIGLAKKAFGKSIKLTLIIQLIIIIAVAFVLIILAERAPNWDFGLPVEIRFIQTSVKVFTVLTIISIVLLLFKLRKKEITAKTGLLHGFLFISSACQIGWFWNWWNITIL